MAGRHGENLMAPRRVRSGPESTRVPAISVGVAVYNGEEYLAELLESVLNQSFSDLEVIISDNASTDRTAEICADLAARDSRVRYHRNASNIGAPANFNRAFSLARARYFCWMSHDDVVKPSFLEKCLRVLEEDDGVVLSHSDIEHIGPDGVALRFDPATGLHLYDYDDESAGDTAPIRPPSKHLAEQDDVVARFDDILRRTEAGYEFALIRRDALAKTSLQRDFFGASEVLLLELALQGRFSMLDEKLFLKRFHPKASFFVPPERKESWLTHAPSGATGHRRFRFTRAYLEVINRSELLTEWQRWRCRALVLRKSGLGIVGKLANRKKRA